MHNYIIIYDNGIKIFELKNNEFKELLHHESEKILQSFISKIEFIKEKDDETIELLTDIKSNNPKRLIVRGAKLFSAKNDFLYKHVEQLGLTIDKFMERKRNLEIQETLRNRNKKVNRNKKGNLKKQVVAIGLLVSISMGVIQLKSCENKELKQEKNNDESPNTTISIMENNSIKEVYYSFDDLTDNGKLENTIKNCSAYLDKYIDRYGLPKDLTYALVCQESGVLDYRVYAGGGSGPMQIQVKVQHGEYYKVPVYKNGVLTGEYDEFFAIDINDKDNPKWQGKKVKIIQSENNFQIGCAYFRRCIDKYKNIFIAVDAYNKGINALSNILSPEELEYFKNDLNNFEWQEIIKNRYGENYGDKNYNDNVLRYLTTSHEGKSTIEYNYNGEKIVIDLYNTRLYNNEIMRG